MNHRAFTLIHYADTKDEQGCETISKRTKESPEGPGRWMERFDPAPNPLMLEAMGPPKSVHLCVSAP